MRLFKVSFPLIIFISFLPVHFTYFQAAVGVVSGLMGIHDYLDRFLGMSEENDGADVVVNIEDTLRAVIDLESGFHEDMKYFQETFKSLEQGHKFHLTMHSLKENFLNVFDQYKTIMRTKARLDKGVLDDPGYFKSQANAVINNYVTENPFQDIHHVIRDDLSNYTSLLSTFMDQFQEFGNVCITRMSSLQLLNKLFEDLKMVAAQTYATLTIAYGILDSFDSHDNDTEKKEKNHLPVKGKIRRSYIKEDIVSVHHKTIIGFKDYLPQLSRAVYNCDQPRHHSDSFLDTYQEIKPFKRVFVEKCHSHQELVGELEPEKQCHSISSASSCSNNTFKGGNVCSVSRQCEKTLHCEDLSDTTVCLSEPLKSQRYEHFYPSNGISERDCERPYHLKEKIFTDYKFYGERPYFWIALKLTTTCNPCQCICVEKDYFINTAPVFTETSRDMVITGAKLELAGNILSIKIQQGKLLPYGKIKADSVKWLPVKMNASQLLKISWDQMRTIDLTRVTLGPGYAVTGVGFAELQHGASEKSVTVAVYGSEFDFREGKLTSSGKILMQNLPRSPTVELKISDFDRPSKADANTRVRIKVDQFIKLTVSGGDDGGQSTIPFIDTQRVVPSVLTPLSGIGLYFRELEKFSGYIGIRLSTYDIVPFMLDHSDAI